MPLFRSSQPANQPTSPPPRPVEDTNQPSRSRSMFNRRRSPSPDPYANSNYTNETSPTTNGSRGGFFSRRRSSSSSRSPTGMGDLRNDPSISGARQKVSDAEAFEREADRALIQARNAVREARDHVRILEREALEEARRAKAKQAEAKTVSKSARGLGRHG